MINQIKLGKPINTEKADKTLAGKAGALTGTMANFAMTGMPAEGAIAKGLSKVGAKKVSKEATKKAVKSIVKSETKKKAKDFGVRRAADVIAGTPLNISMSASESVENADKGNGYKPKMNGKAFAKNLAVNTAMDAVTGGVLEVGGKAVGKGAAKAKVTHSKNKAVVKANVKAKKARIDYHNALNDVKKADTPEAKAKAQIEAKVQKKVAEKAQAKADAIYNENVVKAKAAANVKATAKPETDVPVQKTSQEVTTQAQSEVKPQKVKTINGEPSTFKTENRASKLEEQKLPEQEVKTSKMADDIVMKY